jgi:hypothetical protein
MDGAAAGLTGGKKKRKRKTKWNMEPGLSQVRQAIYVYRNGEMNSVQVERLLGVPPRTLRRYVAESLDPTNRQFYLAETALERQGRMIKEASDKFGMYSEQSFVVALHYMPLMTGAAVAAAGEGGATSSLSACLSQQQLRPHVPAGAAAAAAAHSSAVSAVSPVQFPAAPPRLARDPSLGIDLSDVAAANAATAPFVDIDFSLDSLADLAELIAPLTGHSANQLDSALDALLAEPPLTMPTQPSRCPSLSFVPAAPAASAPASSGAATTDAVGLMEQEHWLERHNSELLGICSR